MWPREGDRGGGDGWGKGRASLGAMSLQVRVGQPEVLLDGLEPGRDYEVSVQSLRGPEASEARGIRARTCECPPQLPAHRADAPSTLF